MNVMFATNLLERREEAGLSRRQVADRMEVSQSLVAHWEMGRRQPTLQQASKLANLYSVPVEIILGPATCNQGPQAYSPAETAMLLGISLSSIYRAIKRGEIRATGIGDRKIIPKAEIDRLLGR